jgi:serine-type D-Ala-D-Ala carboxypeptidase (penicillin-binding protein 5/6)
MRVYPFGQAQGDRLRTRRLAGAVATLLAVAFAAALLAQAAFAPAAQAATRTAAQVKAAGPAGIAAQSAELADAATGKVAWSRDASALRPMGSITKVMTAYLVIEAGHLSRVITVPNGITGYDEEFDASTAGLVPGEKYSALQLLYALMLPSGCDAAYALATAYGSGRATFIAAMNATARRLGLTQTHFTDFSGLPDPTQYSTYSSAHDLIVLGKDAMKLPLLRQIVASRTYHLASSSWHHAHTWVNKNLLLWNYKGAIGIKTGQTSAAGACLLFEARRGSKTLIGVVLHSSPFSLDPAFSDAEKLLNWGFTH